MSHELRTPLNSVLALTQLMLARGPGSAKDAEYLGVIERNGRNLLALINDVLDLSKVEAGRLELEPTRFAAADRVRQCLATVGPTAEEKGLALVDDLAEVPPLVADEGRVRQIVLNLLANAVKFTERGEVAVTLREDARGGVSIAVRDTGPGIPASFLPHLFEPFRQADGSTTRRYEGTGLGLAISQRLAHSLGGSIEVASRPGEGSTFTLWLTLGHAGPAAAPEAAAPAPGAGPLVLVIDDDPGARELLRSLLEGAGYRVATAAGGREGLRLARELKPAAVTLDVLMPDLDGWEVLRELKAAPATAHLPVVMVSVTDDRATGLALGAAAFVTKPVEREALLQALARVAAERPLHRVLHRVLVADDDPVDRERLATLLQGEGYAVDLAADGEDALGRIAVRRPDALVLDLMMPDLDGFGVLARLRAEPATRDLPVVVVTAKELTREERDRLRTTVSGVVGKAPDTAAALLR